VPLLPHRKGQTLNHLPHMLLALLVSPLAEGLGNAPPIVRTAVNTIHRRLLNLVREVLDGVPLIDAVRLVEVKTANAEEVLCLPAVDVVELELKGAVAPLNRARHQAKGDGGVVKVNLVCHYDLSVVVFCFVMCDRLSSDGEINFDN